MKPLFLSCDWGTSSFRLRLINGETLKVLAVSASEEGVAAVFHQWQQQKDSPNRVAFYQAVLQQHIQKMETIVGYALKGIPIIVSGMASSSIGMMALAYKQLPFAASGEDLYHEVIDASANFPHIIVLISGAQTESDVMRGEETQLAGCTAFPQSEQLFIFPGTHSKHVWVKDGFATHFKTYMTGEVFHLLAVQSILSNSVSATGNLTDDANRAAFTQGVLQSRDQHLLHVAFTVRTNDLFHRLSKAENYWYLSGVVIGAELSSLLQWQFAVITIVSEAQLIQSYELAFAALGFTNIAAIAATEAVVAAHAALGKRLQLF